MICFIPMAKIHTAMEQLTLLLIWDSLPKEDARYGGRLLLLVSMVRMG